MPFGLGSFAGAGAWDAVSWVFSEYQIRLFSCAITDAAEQAAKDVSRMRTIGASAWNAAQMFPDGLPRLLDAIGWRWIRDGIKQAFAGAEHWVQSASFDAVLLRICAKFVPLWGTFTSQLAFTQQCENVNCDYGMW